MRIILIGNYKPDAQMSMNLFANLLKKGYAREGHDVEIWYPVLCFGIFASSSLRGYGKWLAYIDKWIIFPLVLKFRMYKSENINAETRFHICDHSNSIYLSSLPNARTIISCHDVLAIRGALGDKDAYCDASRFGIILQKWILKNLLKAKRIAAVSGTTLGQLREFDNSGNKSLDWRLVLNSFNEEFGPVPRQEALKLLGEIGIDADKPFILHVGSSLPRKNRQLLIEMLHNLSEKWDGELFLAGQPIDTELKALIDKKGLGKRVVSIKDPDIARLRALYSLCTAFVFPSFSEGFGWPVIEAQACGAPVITSNIQPLPEISGGSALIADPHKASAFSDAFLNLNDELFRNKLIENGFENCKRFKPERMIKEYLEFHANLQQSI